MKSKEQEKPEKLRGGYYTPADLAMFLVRWIEGIKPSRVLEPSCGDGVFLEALGLLGTDADTLGLEIDAAEARKARKRSASAGLSKRKVQVRDFLGWALAEMDSGSERFDAVVGNPPFIRYQYLPSEFQCHAASIFDRLGCKFTKHTNAWVSFVLASLNLLRPGGRLAMVVPSEIINVTHAQPLRSYLGEHARKVVVIDPEELWFEGTLQGAVLLMVEKKTRACEHFKGLGIHPVRGREFLRADPEEVFDTPEPVCGRDIQGKWTRALLPLSTRDLIHELTESRVATRFTDVAEVDVGIVTGANNFFLVEDDVVERFNLQEWAHPMFGRSEHCPGVVYDEEQHRANAARGKPTNFIWFRDSSVEGTAPVRRYIKQGERARLHHRYKCRVRSPWYSVPSVYSTEIGMLKRAHDTPRLILNRLNAFTTDTAYRVRTKQGNAEQLVYGFLNGLTALSAELEGRHYGGGVLELVPSEIERLLLPASIGTKPRIDDLDKDVRSMTVDNVLALQTERVIGGLGVSASDQDVLLDGWSQLRNRRQRAPSHSH